MKANRAKPTVGLLPALLLLTAVSAESGSVPDSPPLLDFDPSYLSKDLEVPWAGDPFRKQPGFAQVKTVEKPFVLNGIVYSKKEPMAIVNGESVLVGDEIDGRVVHSIGKNYVILRKG